MQNPLLSEHAAVDEFVRGLIQETAVTSTTFEISFGDRKIVMGIPSDHSEILERKRKIAAVVEAMDGAEAHPDWAAVLPADPETKTAAALLAEMTVSPKMTARHWLLLARESGLAFETSVGAVNRYMAMVGPSAQVRLIEEAKNASSATSSGETD
ncbi:hypothetical protein EON81_10745 [bacterium]|nr:MAG: hypothetical protein EON81_10745 [bacterium]